MMLNVVYVFGINCNNYDVDKFLETVCWLCNTWLFCQINTTSLNIWKPIPMAESSSLSTLHLRDRADLCLN